MTDELWHTYKIDGDELKSLSYAIGDHALIHSLWRKLNALEPVEMRLPYVDSNNLEKISMLLGNDHPLVIKIRENLVVDNQTTL